MIPDVSVVLPSYNHARFLEDCVRSVLSQDGVSVELIVCDDASTDDSLARLAGIRDSRLHVIAHRKNLGAAAAVQPGLARARGRYLARLASDDLCLPGRLARQCAWLDAHPETAAVFCLPEFIDEHGAVIDPPPACFDGLFTAMNRPRADWLRTFFTHGNCLFASGAMTRRSLLATIPPTAGVFHHLPDLETWVRICARHDIHVLGEKLAAFRILEDGKNLSSPSEAKSAVAEMEKLAIWRHYTSPDVLALLGFDPGPMGRLQLARWALEVNGPSHRVFAALVVLETDGTGLEPGHAEEFLAGATEILHDRDPLRTRETKRLRTRVAELEDKVRRLGETKVESKPGWKERLFKRDMGSKKRSGGGNGR